MEELAVPVQLGAWEVFLRMLCAMAIGMVIGTEREYSKHPAGMRTHILVALGSCAVMITGQMIFIQYFAYGATPDPARLAAQVITGVGFLGAGTILREGPTVRGLTTAASLWAVASLGVAVGAGYYAVALIGMVCIFVTLTLFETLQNRMIGEGSSLLWYSLETSDISEALDAINRHARKQNAGLRDMHTDRLEDGSFRIRFRAEIGGLNGKKRREAFLANLAGESTVRALRVSNHD